MFLESSLALPFKNTTYGIYAAGNAVSLVGTWMQRISVSWLTWEMSSRAEEFHLRALPEPCMTLSSHTAPDVRPLP